MSILGLGNDIIEIARVRKGFEEHGQPFLNRLFSIKEQEYCSLQKDPFPRYAGRFAAKEAIVKALGCGFGESAGWHDIEVLPEANGKPQVHFSPAMKKRFDDPNVLITISHCKEHATAVALWIKIGKEA